MRTRKEIEADIITANNKLNKFKLELNAFIEAPENNVYASLKDAQELEHILEYRASEDCEGSHNCGASEYTQEFIVDGEHYIAKLEVEYNRHDKTYYYVDGSEFSITKL